MPKSRLDEYETLDDRREVWRQLHSLSPANRVVVLRHFCDMASGPTDGVKPRKTMAAMVEAAYRSDAWDVRLTNEVYSDLWILVTQYKLEPISMGVTLERWARRPGDIPPVRPRPVAATAVPAGSCSLSV